MILIPVRSNPMIKNTTLKNPNSWGTITPLYALNIYL